MNINQNAKPAPIAVDATAGQTLSVTGGNYRILTSGAQTGGAFATIEMLVPPGGGPPPHAHPDFHETFYVVDGEVEVKSEAGTYVAKRALTWLSQWAALYIVLKTKPITWLICFAQLYHPDWKKCF